MTMEYGGVDDVVECRIRMIFGTHACSTSRT